MSCASKISDHYRRTRPASASSISRRSPVFGVGVNDSDYNKGGPDGDCPAYVCWTGMLARCYSETSMARNPTYAGCSVHDCWISFMNFRQWWIENHVDGWRLDKDLLVFGNRVYGPDTCAFVPPSINAFTLDCKSARGEWPIGVRFDRRAKKFRAECRDGFGRAHLGMFRSESDALNAWLVAKLNRLELLKEQMDSIDKRIYKTSRQIILSFNAC